MNVGKKIDPNVVVNNLGETVAAQAIEIAKLKAYIAALEGSRAADPDA